MTDYIEVRIRISPYSSDASDLLAALLADIDYESFVEEGDSLLAYVAAKKYDTHKLSESLESFPMPVNLSSSETTIEGKDWNEEWEKNYFKPIVIADQCVIHSTFHKDVPEAFYDIVIDPKMAFGTGHHSTTSLILQYILTLPLEGKEIADVGTGTGILAILCMMRGAKRAVGIEIDKAAFDNALDNAKLNRADVQLIHGDASALKDAFNDSKVDLLLANINRNIILSDMDRYVEVLNPDGDMILSGFYEDDFPMVEEKASSLGYALVDKKEDKRWVALRFRKRK